MRYKIVLEAHEGVACCEEEIIGHVVGDFINTEEIALSVYTFGIRLEEHGLRRYGKDLYLNARRVLAIREDQ